jgi:hypothetical protein
MSKFLLTSVLFSLTIVFLSAVINPAHAQYPLEDTVRIRHHKENTTPGQKGYVDTSKNNATNPDNTNTAQKEFLFVHGQYFIIADHTSNIKFHESFGGEAGLGFLLDRRSYQKTYLIASVGYNLFRVLKYPSSPSSTVTESEVPVRLGLRRYLIPHFLYVNGDAGLAFIANSYGTPQTPDPSSLRVTADIGVGIIRGGFEAGCTMDTFKEPSPDGWTGTVVLKVGWRFGW